MVAQVSVMRQTIYPHSTHVVRLSVSHMADIRQIALALGPEERGIEFAAAMIYVCLTIAP